MAAVRPFALVLVLALVSGPALAAPPVRTSGIARKADKVVVSVGLQDLFGAREMERLLSGFTTRVLVRVALVREDHNQLLAQAIRWSEIVYDLWDEKLRVRVSTDKPDKPETRVVTTPKAAVELATTLVDFPLSEVGKLDPAATYHLTFRADLNPISEELVTNVRRWLSRPGGRAGSGESFFGSFVSVFVNPAVEDSERILQLVSQPFRIPQGGTP
jgi:hypothetical protein